MLRECCFCGKVNKYNIKTKIGVLCQKHYAQYIKGKPIDNNIRSIVDRNEIIFENNYISIILRNKKQEIVGKCITNKKNFELIKNYKWRLSQGYCVTGNTKVLSIERILLKDELKEKQVVDHINNNPLDNRLKNLRICYQANNCYNKSFMSNNTSGVLGVTWNKEKQTYNVEIRKDKKRYRFFKKMSFEEAVYLRYIAEKELFKEFVNSTQKTLQEKIINQLPDKRKLELEKMVYEKIMGVNNENNIKSR